MAAEESDMKCSIEIVQDLFCRFVLDGLDPDVGPGRQLLDRLQPDGSSAPIGVHGQLSQHAIQLLGARAAREVKSDDLVAVQVGGERIDQGAPRLHHELAHGQSLPGDADRQRGVIGEDLLEPQGEISRHGPERGMPNRVHRVLLNRHRELVEERCRVSHSATGW